MEKFLALPVEKQNAIIDAGLRVFGANGYKKASASDIAGAAGISKAMVFHYFGSKKALYFYLIELCGKMFEAEISEKLDTTETDFFERIRMTTDIEIALMKRHPAILSFLKSFYFEKDEEVKDDIQALLHKNGGLKDRAFVGLDTSKFKDGVDPKLVLKMIGWLGDGYAAHLPYQAEVDYDALSREFDDCLAMLRNNFYKEEYV